jgi:Mn-containing catalase
VLLVFKHEKRLLEIVKVERPNPTYATMLLEPLGGGNGELKAAMQYLAQSFRINDPAIKDLFLDIAAEELSHMEMVATAVNLLNGQELNAPGAYVGQVQSHIVTGLAPDLTNASGVPWTSAYVNVTGDLAADLLSNIAAEQRAKVVYEYLYRQINDRDVKLMIDFLLNREEAHSTLFREAFNRIQGTGSTRDWGVDKDARKYFDLSKPGGQYYDLNKPQPPAFKQPDQPYPQR